jgi:hypothetical protein
MHIKRCNVSARNNVDYCQCPVQASRDKFVGKGGECESENDAGTECPPPMRHFVIVRRQREDYPCEMQQPREEMSIPQTKSDARGSDHQSMGQEDRKEQ